MSWARLLKRVFDIDFEHCPNFGGSLKITAALSDRHRGSAGNCQNPRPSGSTHPLHCPKPAEAKLQFSPNTIVLDTSPVRRYSSRQKKGCLNFLYVAEAAVSPAVAQVGSTRGTWPAWRCRAIGPGHETGPARCSGRPHGDGGGAEARCASVLGAVAHDRHGNQRNGPAPNDRGAGRRLALGLGELRAGGQGARAVCATRGDHPADLRDGHRVGWGHGGAPVARSRGVPGTGRARRGLQAAYLALGVALALWGAFQVMEELTFQYTFEAVHRDLFTGTLATLLVIALVPER